MRQIELPPTLSDTFSDPLGARDFVQFHSTCHHGNLISAFLVARNRHFPISAKRALQAQLFGPIFASKLKRWFLDVARMLHDGWFQLEEAIPEIASELEKQWWDQEDSNLRPQHYQCCASDFSEAELFTKTHADLEFY